MIDEIQLREKLAKILKNASGLHTFAVNPLIDATVKAVRECEADATVKAKVKRALKRK